MTKVYYESINELPRKFTIAISSNKIYTVDVTDLGVVVSWNNQLDGDGSWSYESDLVVRLINSGCWRILDVLVPSVVTPKKKLKLPLAIRDAVGKMCFLTAGDTFFVTLVHSTTGEVFKNHVTEIAALAYLEGGDWAAVGDDSKTKLEEKVCRANWDFAEAARCADEAKVKMEQAVDALANYKPKYLE